MNSALESMNPEQQEAVRTTEGPLLILAGAGSGKTRVLTHRIAYLIDEKDVRPWHILAITFTNKAAGEMRERVNAIAGEAARDVWVATFHSTCVRILRRYIDRLGYDRNFTIYDTADQKTVMKEVFRQQDLDPKQFKEKTFLNRISNAKDQMIGWQDDTSAYGSDYGSQLTAKVYEAYQKRLIANNALDFDDLLFLTVQLFQENPDVLAYYQERFRYIMVDEYQDTNGVQFRFVSMLADRYHNLCVVGDDDQSIYGFRGADIRNILDFEKTFPDAKVIKLEQNYRSTKSILNAANDVISNNRGRKDKKLWTGNEQGQPVVLREYSSEYDEAWGVVRDIENSIRMGAGTNKDYAVLYRTNAQSRVLEEKFVQCGVPYRIVGGVSFYQRMEIKDLIAYLKVIAGSQDDVSLRRIINVPKRGIGATTVEKAASFAGMNQISLYEALHKTDSIPGLGRSASRIHTFVDMIDGLKQKAGSMPIADLFDEIMEDTGYRIELETENTDEAHTRLDNLDELRNKIVSYEESAQEPTLDGLLEEIALVADVDSMDDNDNKVTLMTLHSAKGLEFPYVYMTGMEDGLFPGYLSISSGDEEDIEEERRLCYVGITRAQKKLTMTWAYTRMVRGTKQINKVSRFVEEISPEDIDNQSGQMNRGGFGNRSGSFGSGSQSGFGGGRSGYGGYGAGAAGGYAARQGSTDRTSFSGGRRRTKRTDSTDRAARFMKEYIKKGTDIVKEKPDYSEGDSVRHIKFGTGTVKEIKDIGNDYEVTVDFEKAGIRKMRAAYAKLKKV